MHACLYNTKENKFTQLDEGSLFDCTLASDSPDCEYEPLNHPDVFLWVDMTAPTPEQIDQLGQRFKLDPQLLEDIVGREGRPKLHDYDDYIYLVFHALCIVEVTENRLELKKDEIDCIVGPDWVVTLHHEPLKELEELVARWKRRPEWMRNGPGHLLYEIMDAVLDGYFPLLDDLDVRIDGFEDRLYQSSQDEVTTVPLSGDIFTLKRILLEVRHVAGPTRDVANVLLRRDAEAGGKHFAAFQDLYDHASRIVENIDTYRDILAGALDAYLAIESNRMNLVMKRLTAYSITLLVPSWIAGVYGMNFDDMPNHHGFWGAVSVMLGIVALLMVYFKKRNWI